MWANIGLYMYIHEANGLSSVVGLRVLGQCFGRILHSRFTIRSKRFEKHIFTLFYIYQITIVFYKSLTIHIYPFIVKNIWRMRKMSL